MTITQTTDRYVILQEGAAPGQMVARNVFIYSRRQGCVVIAYGLRQDIVFVNEIWAANHKSTLTYYLNYFNFKNKRIEMKPLDFFKRICIVIP